MRVTLLRQNALAFVSAIGSMGNVSDAKQRQATAIALLILGIMENNDADSV